MYAIKLDANRELTTTIHSKIYQGDKNADTLVFVIPKVYGTEELDLASCTFLLRYVLPNGKGYTEELLMYPIPRNEDYLQYRLSLSSKFTECPGTIHLWLTAIDFNDHIVLHTDTADVEVIQRVKIEDYMPAESLDTLDKLAMQVEQLQHGFVNNLYLDTENETLQLTANGTPIGDAVDVDDWKNKGVIYYDEKEDE